MFRQDKPMRHLPRDHPQVQHVTDFINLQITTGSVHPKLVMNFDQIWTCLYEPMRRVLWKGESSGPKDDLASYPSRQSIRAEMQKHFGQVIQQPKHEKEKAWSVKRADIAGTGQANTINHWRNPQCIFCILLKSFHPSWEVIYSGGLDKK